MSKRKIPLVNGNYYHILNRSLNSLPIFFDKKSCERAIESLFYYQNRTFFIKYSRLITLPIKEKNNHLDNLRKKSEFEVEIVCYCLMPNHFHFLLKQIKDNGISKYMGNFTNSYVRYFNTRRERKGPLFESKFKSIRVETDEQLLHLSRYIHLNPYSAGLIKKIENVENYPYSSFGEYLNPDKQSRCQKDIILNQFKDAFDYQVFVLDQADYQKNLQIIKNLALEG